MTMEHVSTIARPARLRPSTFADISPNWYATVMGTGIVAVAAASLPVTVPGLHPAAVTVWALAVVVLGLVTAATVVHWVGHPVAARAHLGHPVMANFYGAPPMALLTVGAGTLVLGRDVLGLPLAVGADATLWTVGTVAGLATAIVVPYRTLTRRPRPAASGAWLMPVVPPMVSASTGALLVPHAPPGAARTALLLACYALFAVALAASVVVIALIARRLAVHGPDEAAAVPLLWIVLGPLGQSVTAANLLGAAAGGVLPAPAAASLRAFGIGFGVPVWACALVWAGVAGAVTVRAARTGLPFGLPWWSFTFPVGTVVTATSGLALHTGSTLFVVAAAAGYALLVAAWMIVAGRTVHALGTRQLPVRTPGSRDCERRHTREGRGVRPTFHLS